MPGKRDHSLERQQVEQRFVRLTAHVSALESAATVKWTYVGDVSSVVGGSTVFTDANGNRVTHRFSGLLLLSTTKATGTPLASTTTFTHDPTTLAVSAITDPNGHTTSATYDGDGNTLTARDALGRTTTYTYNGLDKQTSVVSPMGEKTVKVYDVAGNVKSVTDPLNNTTTFAYNDAAHPGDVTSSTNPVKDVTRFEYDNNGNLTSVTTNPAAGVTRTSRAVYDADGEMICQASPNAVAAHTVCPVSGGAHVNGTTAMTYDGAGQLLTRTDPLGRVTTSAYDGNGNQVQVIDANGHVSKIAYDPANRPVALTRPDGTTQRSTFDLNGNQLTQVDGAGNATTYRYDALDRVIASVDPLGRTTAFGYDRAGNRTTLTDPQARVTSSAYDDANQLTAVTYSDGATPNVTYSYDKDGHRVGMADGTGSSAYAFDADGRLTSSINGAGAKVGYGYDAASRLTTLVYPNNKAVTRSYDGAGQLTKITDWLGHATTFGYDGNGNTASQTDPNGIATNSTYDSTDQLTSIVDHKGAAQIAKFNYTRDNLGDVTSATGGANGTDTYSYNSLQQLSSVNNKAYSYDKADNLASSPLGNFTSDKASQLTKATNGPVTKTFSYDPEGNRTSQVATTTAGASGCSLCVTDPTASSALSVTGAGSVQTNGAIEVDSTSRSALSASGAGKITAGSVTAAGGAAVVPVATVTPATKTSTPGAGSPFGGVGIPSVGGNQTAVNVAQAGSKVIRPGVYSTIKVGGAGSVNLQPGSYVVTGGIDVTDSGKLSGSGVTIYLACGSYPKPCSGNGAGINVHGAGQMTLKGAAQGAPNGLSVVADAGDTASLQVQDGASLNVDGSISAPASALQLNGIGVSSTVNGVVAVGRVSVDGSAKLTVNGKAATGGVASPTTTYRYDQANRLVGLTSPTAQASYAYDGDGTRMAKTVGGTKTAFAWDQSSGLPLRLTDGNDAYVYGPDGTPIEKINGTTATYFQKDQQGSTRLLTDQNGNAVGTYAYDAYGNVTAHTGASTPFQYNGQYSDAESGFQYLRARYYDPSTGQFVGRDLLVDSTKQPYSYADNDPVNNDDPTGLLCFLGGNPNGSCRAANATRTYADVASGLQIVADVFGAAAATAAVVGVFTDNPVLAAGGLAYAADARAASAFFGASGAVATCIGYGVGERCVTNAAIYVGSGSLGNKLAIDRSDDAARLFAGVLGDGISLTIDQVRKALEAVRRSDC